MTSEWAAVEGTMERANTGSPSGSPTSPNSPGGDKFPKEIIIEKDGITTTISTANQSETRHKADGSRVKIVKRVKTTKILRPQNGADLRIHFAKFGKGLENEPGLTAKEAPIPFELGALDAEEKKCRDEIVKTMNLSLDAPIKLPQIRKSALATAPVQAASTQGSSTAADVDGKPKTWAAGKKKEEEEKKKETKSSGIKGASNAEPNEVIRISNLTDEISEVEIRRLFGPGNDLGEIRRVFIAKDKQGNRRGFAYVTYGSKREAEKAVAKMHKRKFKHAVLLVDYGTAR